MSRKPREATVDPYNIGKILKVVGAHNWKNMTENFNRRTKEVAEQSVRQLKIFTSRLASLVVFIQQRTLCHFFMPVPLLPGPNFPLD